MTSRDDKEHKVLHLRVNIFHTDRFDNVLYVKKANFSVFSKLLSCKRTLKL